MHSDVATQISLTRIPTNLKPEAETLRSQLKSAQQKAAISAALAQEAEARAQISLALASSMLAAEAKRSLDTKASATLRGAAGGLFALSAAHRRLVETQGSDAIRFDDYLQQLCAGLEALSGRSAIKVCAASGPHAFPSRIAIPLGLFAARLAMSSFARAFASLGAGRVKITLESRGAGRYALTVDDDGDDARLDGADLDPQLTELARQLNGEMRIFAPGAFGRAVELTFSA